MEDFFEGGPLPGFTSDGDVSCIVLDNAMDHSQSPAGTDALFLDREIGIEDALNGLNEKM